jgi:uncharacterized protein (DUF849 family)
MKLEYYREVVERIRSSDTDLIINLTAGPGGRFIPSDDEPAKAAPGTVLTTPEIRTAHIVELRRRYGKLNHRGRGSGLGWEGRQVRFRQAAFQYHDEQVR